MLVPSAGATDVPVNATPILTAELPGLARLVGVGGEELPTTVENFDIEDGFGTTEMTRLRPVSLLPSNSVITIEVDGDALSTFETGSAADDEAPPAPVLGAAEDYSGGACTPFVQIPVTGNEDAALFIARTDGTPELRGNANLNGVATGTKIVVSGEPSDDAPVAVAAVDFAGNVSEPTEIRVQFPAEIGLPTGPGCSHSSAAAGNPGIVSVAGLACLLALARRRTRRA